MCRCINDTRNTHVKRKKNKPSLTRVMDSVFHERDTKAVIAAAPLLSGVLVLCLLCLQAVARLDIADKIRVIMQHTLGMITRRKCLHNSSRIRARPHAVRDGGWQLRHTRKIGVRVYGIVILRSYKKNKPNKPC